MRSITVKGMAYALVLSLGLLFTMQVAAEPIKLTFTGWGTETVKTGFRELASAFNESQSKIQVEYLEPTGNYWEQLKLNVVGKTGFDLYWTQEMVTTELIAGGWFLNLNKYIETDKEFSTRRFFPGLYDSFTWEGKIGAVPVVTHLGVLYYNPTLFGQGGIAIPKKVTWDDLIKTGRRLTKKDADGQPTQVGHRVEYGTNYNMYYLWQAGGGILSKDLRKSLLNTPETTTAAHFIHDLAWEHGVSPKPGAQMQKFIFQNGAVAMYTHGSWMIDNLVTTFNFTDFGVLPAPVGKNEITTAYPNGFGISASTPYPDAAWEFVKFCSGSVGQVIAAQSGMGVPVIQDSKVINAFTSGPTKNHRLKAVEGLGFSRAPWTVPGMQLEIIDRVVNPGLAKIWRNEVAPENILSEIDRTVQQYLDTAVFKK